MAMFLFYAFAAVTLFGAFAVALSGRSKGAGRAGGAAGGLILAFAGMAGFYLLLHAAFLAAVQLVVAIGATVLILLTGMALTGGVSEAYGKAGTARALLLAAGIAVFLAALFIAMPWQTRAAGEHSGSVSVEAIGAALISWQSGGYLVPLELMSLLAVVVMIGCAYLTKRRRPLPPAGPPYVAPSAPSPRGPARQRGGR